MKKLVGIVILAVCFFQVNAQVIINEINYNPPEAGNDFLEYIELYNTSPQKISLNKYQIQDAVNIVFPDTTIPGNGYFVICGNAKAIDSIYHIKALQWSSGTLLNSSELITLMDSAFLVIDSVRYSDSKPWPAKADGFGSSLELCRSEIDNALSDYWKASTNKISNVLVNDSELFGTPGKANQVECSEYVIDVADFRFLPENIIIYEGEYIEWTNSNGFHNVNGKKTLFPGNPEEFYSGPVSPAGWKYIKRFDQLGNYQYQCDAHSSIMQGTITVKARNVEYPNYPIGLVTSTNSQGEVDSINSKCQLDGIVYGVNLRPSGLQFTLIDNLNDGIAVFSANAKYSYNVKEGDLISVRGVVTQFNGLAEIVPDTIIKVSSDNPLTIASTVTSLSELTESQLVRIRNVQIVNPLAWTNNPNGFTVQVTDGITVFDVRIDNDVNLASMKVPTGKFDLTGIGSQFDPTAPYLEGYQIFPRYVNDISPYIPFSPYKKLTIAQVTSNKANGVVDSLGVLCELTGLVYGIDYIGGSGIQFTIHDNTGGINVFNSSKEFSYKVQEGDEVKVQGKIDQFRGLTQLLLDTIIKISSNNQIKTPTLVTNLSESTESELVQIKGLNIIDPNEWRGNGTTFTVRTTDGVNVISIRIDDNCELSNMPAQAIRLNVIGIGGQSDPGEPYDSDYLIFPRYKSDITWAVATDDANNYSAININPNPVSENLQLQGQLDLYHTIEIYDSTGKLIQKQKTEPQIQLNFGQGVYYVVLRGIRTKVIPFEKM